MKTLFVATRILVLTISLSFMTYSGYSQSLTTADSAFVLIRCASCQTAVGQALGNHDHHEGFKIAVWSDSLQVAEERYLCINCGNKLFHTDHLLAQSNGVSYFSEPALNSSLSFEYTAHPPLQAVEGYCSICANKFPKTRDFDQGVTFQWRQMKRIFKKGR